MASPPPPKMAKKASPWEVWRRWMGKGTTWLLAAAVAALFIQMYLGGGGLLGANAFLGAHKFFAGYVIRALFALIMVVGFISADWPIGLVGLALTLMLELQYPLIGYFTAEVRALHVANGVLMFAVSLIALTRRLPWMRWSPE